MSSKNSTDSAVASIAERFEACFHQRLRPLRRIGREAEFPVVLADGCAADVNRLWQPLRAESGFKPYYDDPRTRALLVGVEREDWNIAVEVGRGTIELSLGPYDDLWKLQESFQKAMALLVRVASAQGMYLLGFGIQPRTRPSAALMTRRPRYAALYGAVGAPWLALTTTAADQTHVDISRRELIGAINWMNLLSAPIIALCSNSSVYAGRMGQYLSGREGVLRELGKFRYGMTPRRFGSIEEFISYLCEYVCFVLPRDAGRFKRVNRSFTEYVRRHPETSFEQFLWHEHYVWNSARARVQNSTIEVRPACQQPPGESLAANALILGLVESLPEVAAYFEDAFGNDPWPAMIAYRSAVVRDGLEAPEPVPGLLRSIVKIAEAGLGRRGRDEGKFLAPVWLRLDARTSPAMHARDTFREHGLEGLLGLTRY